MRLASRTIVPSFLAVLLVVPPLAGCAARDATTQERPEQVAVEQHLLPGVLLAGQAEPHWTIRTRMERYHVPGLGVAVIDHGDIRWIGAYGVKRAGTSEAITASTLFQAASISKLATATGALRLIDEGKLSLDEDVNARLTSWHLPYGAHDAPGSVTLSRLLSHTAGIGVEGFPGYVRGTTLPSLHDILDGDGRAASPPVRIEGTPGSSYRYSGGGYEIVQQLIKDVTHADFAALMRQQLFEPLGMTHSAFEQPLSRAFDVAAGHGYDGTAVEGGWRDYPELAAAGLWSTPADLARLGIGLSRSLRGLPGAVLGKRVAQAMMTKTLGDMGLGPGLHDEGGGLFFDHAGSNSGYRIYIVVHPLTGNGVVVMTNGDGGDDLIYEIVRSVARVYRWGDFLPVKRETAKLGVAALDARTGAYDVDGAGFAIEVRREQDHLTVATPRGSRYTFYPSASKPSEYFAIEDGSTLVFSNDGKGRATLAVWGMAATRR
jgi:CubicO group peptidase (beta-lactamase class C family)